MSLSDLGIDHFYIIQVSWLYVVAQYVVANLKSSFNSAFILQTYLQGNSVHIRRPRYSYFLCIQKILLQQAKTSSFSKQRIAHTRKDWL